jgi:hypothetical protein
VSQRVASMSVKKFSCDGNLFEKNLGRALKRHLLLHGKKYKLKLAAIQHNSAVEDFFEA